MKSSFLKNAAPHLLAIGIFLIVAVIYCQPALQGKVVDQEDMVGYKGMAQQSFEYKEKYGHFPLWTNSLFGGMPAFAVAMDSKYGNPTKFLYDILRLGLPNPAAYFFMGCICFYFLCMVLRIRPLLAIIGALAFAYSSYSAVIIAVGHETKMQAMMLMPAVIASVLLLFERKYLIGTALLAMFFAFQIGSQHLQVVYYTLITIGLLTIAQVVKSYKEKQLKNTAIAVALAAVAGLIGFGTYAVSLLPFKDYSNETMRGGRTDLTKSNDPNATKGGLDKEYAFRWSYGIPETMTLMVPGIYGGSNNPNGREHTGSGEFTDKLSAAGMPEESALQYLNAYSYWGDQPNTMGTVYVGAVVCFLFVFGMLYLKSWHKWWILAAVVVAIVLAWGRHFSAINYLLFDYLPLYKNFRAPTVALVVPQLLMPLLSVLALESLLRDQSPRAAILKKWKHSLLVSGALFVILGLFYFSASFKGSNDNSIRDNFTQMMLRQAPGQQPSPELQQQAASFGQSIVKALQDDRKSLFAKDLMRSFFFVALAAALLWGFIANKWNKWVLMVGMLLLVSIDLLAVDVRYLNKDNYKDPEEFERVFTPTQADQMILADPNKPYRVFDQSDQQNGPFNSSRASYFHNSVGGYHPAKLGLYQDLIENQLANMNINVYNMLNTKYFIMNDPQTGQPVAQINPGANGPAWFVKNIHFVKNADEEMRALDSISTKDTVLIQEKFKGSIPFQPQFDSAATIQVTDYANDTIRYKVSAKTNQFAVFSEIYYPRGWNATIDGKKAEILKVNYTLRGMPVPAGEHTIEFKFEPESYKTGDMLMLISSILTLGLLLVAIVIEVRKYMAKAPAPAPEKEPTKTSHAVKAK